MSPELKADVLSAFESKEMRDHIENCLEELPVAYIIGILVSAIMPLERKLNIFERLALECPESKDDERKTQLLCSYDALRDMLRSGLDNMLFRAEEQAVYILYVCKHGDKDFECLFLTFDAAVRYAQNMTSVELEPPDTTLDNAEWYYIIEKWMPSSDNMMDETFNYLLLPDGTVIHAEYADNLSTSCHSLSLSCCSLAISCTLTIPVPFDRGDIVTLNPLPFDYIRHCIIIDSREEDPSLQWDCCLPQCLYVNQEDNTVKIGALKHSAYFPDFRPFSPLLRAEVFTGELPEDEKFMYELSEVFKSLPVTNNALWDALHRFVWEGTTTDMITEKLKAHFHME